MSRIAHLNRSARPAVAAVVTFACLSTVSTLCFAQNGATGCESAGCHEGIEPISPSMDVACTACHKGDGVSVDKATAHTGMYSNPSDFRVVDETCGPCHPAITARMKKSLHATAAGVISGTRWTWGAQDVKSAIYATVAVSDDDGDVPTAQGAVASLEKIPQYSPEQPEGPTNTPADDYLRNQCLRCHLWSGGHERAGDWRASGCAACHMLYSDDGLYEGSDPTIDPFEPGHPIRHEITNKIPETQCIHCHNRGGRTGVSYIGTMEADNYGSPWTAMGETQPKLHSKWYNHLAPDIHMEKGMTCIDCHTMLELHGDGNIYSKKEEALEVECVNCHGTVDAKSTLTTSRGNPLENLSEKPDGSIVLTTKIDGVELPVRQISEIPVESRAGTAMKTITRHLERMECYACHARWVPQCYGCHAKQDLRSTGRDWIDPTPDPDDPSRTAKKAAADASQIAYGWAETRSYLRWETPVLGINSDHQGNRVSPFTTGCQVFFTQIGADGQAIVHNKVFTAADGNSGIAQNPIQPHTISDNPRTCEDCHNSDKALGLGTGTYNPVSSGLGISFELERIVDEEGNQIQTTSHDGARPFTAAEMEAMRMAPTCTDCHGDPGDTNAAPLANAGGPYAGTAGDAITFDGSGSSDPDGAIVSHVWDFGDGSVGAGVSPTHAYVTAGSYTVMLTVVDSAGATSTSQTAASIELAEFPSEDAVELEIKKLGVTKSTKLSKVKPLVIKLTVRNIGENSGPRTAAVLGSQAEEVVYSATVSVSPLPRKSAKYFFPSFTPAAEGTIEWTAILYDDDAEEDMGTATSQVKP